MRLHTDFCLVVVVLCAAPLQSQNDKAEASFNKFFAEFKSAVLRKDERALAEVMASRLSFIRDVGVSRTDVFKGLAADDARGWINLQDAVQRGMFPSGTDYKTTGRVLRCTPTDILYSCFVLFERDNHYRWRWTGMVMPTR